jgi:type I restriction enzyme S subunit
VFGQYLKSWDMRSNYKPLGKYVQLVIGRNNDLGDLPLVGLSIQKKFISSIANTIGTDMSTYRIIERNQFAYGPITSRNGDKITIALFNEYDKALISQAYIPFEVKDTSELDPEYLMMWFRRPEFDRYARFKSHGSAREIFDWEEMCNTLLPVPHIDKQREIVKEYNTIQNRINLNNQLIQKLEETAQAIYREWFVEFEFPDENGKPYKSNGGEMVGCEELGKEIPKGWSLKFLYDICDVVNGRAYAEEEFRESGTPIIRIQNLSGGSTYVYSDFKLENDKYVENGDLIFAWSATFGPFIWRGVKSIYHYHIWKLKFHWPELKYLLYIYFLRETKRVSGEGSGSIFAHITKSLMESQKVLVPDLSVLKQFHLIAKHIDTLTENLLMENQKLTELKDLLLSKMATINN